jgi:excisionase family DNA binding protein
MAERAFTVRDVAQRYRVSEHTVLGWIRSGDLAAVNVGRRPGARKPRWRIAAHALTTFELRRTSAPPSPRLRRCRRPADVIAFYT